MELKKFAKVLALTSAAALTAGIQASSLTVGTIYANNGVYSQFGPYGNTYVAAGGEMGDMGIYIKAMGDIHVMATIGGSMNYHGMWNSTLDPYAGSDADAFYALNVKYAPYNIKASLGRMKWQSAFEFDVSPNQNVNFGDVNTSAGYALATTTGDCSMLGKWKNGTCGKANAIYMPDGVALDAGVTRNTYTKNTEDGAANTLNFYNAQIAGWMGSGDMDNMYTNDSLAIGAGPYFGSTADMGLSFGYRTGIVGPEKRPQELHAEYAEMFGDAQIKVGISHDTNLSSPFNMSMAGMDAKDAEGEGKDTLISISGKMSGFGAQFLHGKSNDYPGAPVKADDSLRYFKVGWESTDLTTLGQTSVGLGMLSNKKSFVNMMTNAVTKTKLGNYRLGASQMIDSLNLKTTFYLQKSKVTGDTVMISPGPLLPANTVHGAQDMPLFTTAPMKYKPIRLAVFKLTFNW